jgi:chromosome segregation ATPase
MPSLLKALRGNGEHPDPAQIEMRELANRIHNERKTLEQLMSRARGSSSELGKLAEPLTRISDRLAAVERRLSAIETSVPTVSTVQDKTEGLLTLHREVETRVGESAGELGRIKSQLGDLAALVETAIGLRGDLSEFREFEEPFRVLRGDAEELKARMAELSDSYGRLRQRHDDLSETSKDATSRLVAIEGASQGATRAVEDQRRRVDELEQSIARLTQLAAGASEARQQLLTLKSLSDQVTQKVAALENQRGAVERVAKDVSRLDELVRKVDAAIRTQEDQIFNLHSLATDVDDLRSLYESVAARSQEISHHQQQVEEQEHATRQKLANLSEQLRRANERFDLEHRGLETVSHRISDLRNTLKDCEQRMGGLDTASRTVTELQSKADHIWARVDFLTGEMAKLDEQPERMRILRADALRLQELMDAMSARSVEIEQARPEVERVVGDLATLKSTHEAITDALERMKATQDEMGRVRINQGQTDTWLKTVEVSVADLRERVTQLDAARPAVEAVQKDVERVVGAMDAVAARRQFLEEMQTRLAELGSLGGQLDDRTKAFRSRLDVAEGRFLFVTKQAEEAERIANLVTRVAGTVTEANSRIAEVMRSIAGLEGRSQHLEGIADRVYRLGTELEQRQTALDRASEHLARASTLRQEAADAVQQLGEQSRTLHATLDSVDERARRLEALAAELDGCSVKLRSAEKGMAQFQKDLVGWELAKLELGRGMEEVRSRQSTVDALQVNVSQMFELAERTADDLKAAAETQQEIRESKASFDDLLRRVREAESASAGFEARRQEIEHAERRLARAEALLIDIQASLETLNKQKVLLDLVIEQTGSLTFQVQQAEALIDRLRRERDITNAVRTALEDSGTRSLRPGRSGS